MAAQSSAYFRAVLSGLWLSADSLGYVPPVRWRKVFHAHTVNANERTAKYFLAIRSFVTCASETIHYEVEEESEVVRFSRMSTL